MIARRHSRRVSVGRIPIGGSAPIVLQSMTNTPTVEVEATANQVRDLLNAGCDLVRIAVPDFESARAFGKIKKLLEVPLIADIHFDYRLAIAAIEYGADKIRINPGNIGSFERVRKIIQAASFHNIPLRVGVNAGSLEKRLRNSRGVTVEAMLESCWEQVAAIEREGESIKEITREVSSEITSSYNSGDYDEYDYEDGYDYDDSSDHDSQASGSDSSDSTTEDSSTVSASATQGAESTATDPAAGAAPEGAAPATVASADQADSGPAGDSGEDKDAANTAGSPPPSGSEAVTT